MANLLLSLLGIAVLTTFAVADDCPAKAEFNGCFKDGCITVPTGPAGSSSKTKVVCGKCVGVCPRWPGLSSWHPPTH